MTQTVFTTLTRVYYEDTDMAGVVYYANYLKYIERGRSDMLRQLHIDQAILKERYALVFVVRNVTAHYHAPAVFDNELTIETRPQKIRGASIQVMQKILHKDRLLFSAEVGLVCVGVTDFKPARLPPQIVDKLNRT